MTRCPFRLMSRSFWRSIYHSSKLKRIARAGAGALVLAATLATPALADQPISYTVQAGDTLLAISQQFSVPATNIASVNGLEDPNQLAIGQTLTIDVPTSSGGQSIVNLQSGAHYPAFAIDLNGDVVRTLSPFPPAPALHVLAAPYHSQFDGSIWAESNCGPTTLSMALGALGVTADQLKLRDLANQQMGMADPGNGTTWESLAYAARASGAKTEGLDTGQSYRVWTVAGLKQELERGRPVVLLVRYWDLPDHVDSSFAGDHYIVGLGFDQNGNLIYDDPAFRGDGSDRAISQAALDKAWTNTAVGFTRTAMALYK
ncbi:MAG: C39 family peptidase [Chloroflexota bacterium]